jgi:predicted AlkP superfamily pyrophosphatase or phosphodiesterase
MAHPPTTAERPAAEPHAEPVSTRPPLPPVVVVIACVAGLTALVCTWLGSISVGLVAGVAVLVVALALLAWIVRHPRTPGPTDGSRRRFLQVGLGGAALVGVGAALGRGVDEAMRPDAIAVQDAAAGDLGAEYMELVGRAANAQRSGDIQLLLAPFNSANYSFESLSLHPRDPRTSHAAVWMYLERIPLVAYGPGVIEPGDSEDRVSLADLAPTTAELIGFDGWANDREGRRLPGFRTTGTTPKVVVTYVFDGGGWNVLRQWPNDWPNLARLMREGMHYRNALTGSFPAVTACAHASIGTGTFPRQHGITGHNIRDGAVARKAYRTPGHADPSDILVPTLSDLWHDTTGAWVGQIGYQVWHMGMIGHGGIDRTAPDLPVGVYFDEPGGGGWQPHNPDLFRLPEGSPGMDVLDARMQTFEPNDPGWDPEWEPWRTTYCCVPPIAAYQGDLLEATLTNEPIGQGNPSLLYTTFKSPDYTGHVYGMQSKWEGLMLQAVDEELGRIVRFLDQRFPGEYALFVTADHGQCPLPDSMGGVRLDPIQLEAVIEREFGAGLGKAVQYTAPSEVYLDRDALRDAGATTDDVAAALRNLTYRQNLGPYVPASAIEQNLLDSPEFAAVFSSDYLLSHEASGWSGSTIYTGRDVDQGMPEPDLYT